MLTKVFRFYTNYEKEERWLNEMSARGFALVDFSFPGVYRFAPCVPGEFIYRIELLAELPTNPLSHRYINFLEESGVELVTNYIRWAYFRKPAADGPFDLYSDIDTRMQHYRRIWLMYLILSLAFTPSVVLNTINALSGYVGVRPLLLVLVGVQVFLVGVLYSRFIAIFHKYRKLKKEKTLRE